jgi:hypothetical protein
MAAKYDALAALEALPPGPQQDAAIRAAAKSWPGSLRESQLAGPARCRGRREQALAGLAVPEQPRADWRDRGATPVVLWADLHPLLADVLAWRVQHSGRGGAADLLAFVRRAGGAERWPETRELLETVAGTQVRARMAYAWLAAQAGLEQAGLQQELFGRPGHWDARPGDPPFVL